MDLLQLNYFRVVARVEHMTQAADELFIAQPSLSKTIGRLEKELGVPLFDRQGRNIQLNQFGKAFLTQVETVFQALEEGQRKVRTMAGLEEGVIMLGTCTLKWMPDLLKRFMQKYPKVQFQLAQRSMAELIPQLERGDYDFCFPSSPIVKPGIHWEPLVNEELYLVVPPTHPMAQRGVISLREMVQEPLVIEKVGTGLRDIVDQFCQEAGFTPRIMCEVDEPAIVLEFVEAGIGVAFAPGLIKEQIKSRNLVALRLIEPCCPYVFGIAWPENHYHSEAARTFHQFVIEDFARYPTFVPCGLNHQR